MTDASRHAMGAVGRQGEYPVAFGTRTLGDRESSAPAYDLQLFGILHAPIDGESRWDLGQL